MLVFIPIPFTKKGVCVVKIVRLFVSLEAALFAASHLLAGDWPTFMGPDGDAVVKNYQVSTNWKQEPPKIIWRKSLGSGNASLVIANGRAVTLGNEEDKDIVWCLDAQTGDALWKFEYDEPKLTECGEIGPSSTPTIDGNRVYTVGNSGQLFCLDLATGKLVWKKNYMDDLEGRKPICGWAASPLISGNQLIVDPGAADGAIAALDKRTGEVLWKSGNAKAGCATPLLYSHEGKNALAFFQGDKLIGYNLDRQGEVLYEFTWRTFNSFNASKPKYKDGRIFISSGYGQGYAVVDLTGEEPELLHRNRELPLQFQNSLLIDGDILGIFGDNRNDSQLIRMNMDTGDIRWKLDYPGNRGNLLAIGDKIIAITETGKIVLGNATREEFETLAEMEILPEKVWAVPAFSNGYIYVRNTEGETVCIKLPSRRVS